MEKRGRNSEGIKKNQWSYSSSLSKKRLLVISRLIFSIDIFKFLFIWTHSRLDIISHSLPLELLFSLGFHKLGVPVVMQKKQIWLGTWGCRFNPWPHSVGKGASIAMSCGVGHRHSSDLALLCLWHRLVATSLIGPLAWEPPYAVAAALTRPKVNKIK